MHHNSQIGQKLFENTFQEEIYIKQHKKLTQNNFFSMSGIKKNRGSILKVSM